MKITVALTSRASVNRDSIRHPCGRTGVNATSRQPIFPPCCLEKGHESLLCNSRARVCRVAAGGLTASLDQQPSDPPSPLFRSVLEREAMDEVAIQTSPTGSTVFPVADKRDLIARTLQKNRASPGVVCI